jgi:hypothetical protein
MPATDQPPIDPTLDQPEALSPIVVPDQTEMDQPVIENAAERDESETQEVTSEVGVAPGSAIGEQGAVSREDKACLLKDESAPVRQSGKDQVEAQPQAEVHEVEGETEKKEDDRLTDVIQETIFNNPTTVDESKVAVDDAGFVPTATTQDKSEGIEPPAIPSTAPALLAVGEANDAKGQELSGSGHSTDFFFSTEPGEDGEHSNRDLESSIGPILGLDLQDGSRTNASDLIASSDSAPDIFTFESVEGAVQEPNANDTASDPPTIENENEVHDTDPPITVSSFHADPSPTIDAGDHSTPPAPPVIESKPSVCETEVQINAETLPVPAQEESRITASTAPALLAVGEANDAKGQELSGSGDSTDFFFSTETEENAEHSNRDLESSIGPILGLDLQDGSRMNASDLIASSDSSPDLFTFESDEQNENGVDQVEEHRVRPNDPESTENVVAEEEEEAEDSSAPGVAGSGLEQSADRLSAAESDNESGYAESGAEDS